jgi:hypothetical protein
MEDGELLCDQYGVSVVKLNKAVALDGGDGSST